MSKIALHGFLGQPTDWAPVLGFAVDARDLLPDAALSFEAWTERFLASFSRDSKPVLIGYSMGGRLAMHAVLRAPERFRGVVFISSNPGLSEGHEARLAADLEWARRFREEPWGQVLAAWNAQPVLRGGVEPDRSGLEARREEVAAAMDSWSLGRQRDLRAGLARLEIPHLFLTGERDEKFTRLMLELTLAPLGERAVIEGAGHRILFDEPTRLGERIREFTSKL